MLQHSSYNSGTVDYDFAVLRLLKSCYDQMTDCLIVTADMNAMMVTIEIVLLNQHLITGSAKM